MMNTMNNVKMIAVETAIRNINGQDIAREAVQSLADTAKVMLFVGKVSMTLAKVYTGMSKSTGMMNTLGIIIDRVKYIVADVVKAVREDKVLRSAIADLNGTMEGELDSFKSDFEDLAKSMDSFDLR